MTEIYKQIPNYPNYAVSNYGNVKNIITNKILKPIYNNKGYFRVSLNQKWIFIHRLIAMTFLKNPESKPTIDHIDRNRTNNKLENLRYATYKENVNNRSISKKKTI